MNKITFKEYILEATDKKLQRFEKQRKLADQLSKYGHRWNENPSSRMANWVDEYNNTKEKFQKEGIWDEYCKKYGFFTGHDAFDSLA